MISPVIVEQIHGVWTARCEDPACGEPHVLHRSRVVLGRERAAAENAADRHLKEINGHTAPNPKGTT